jgi:hypothetical protein
VGRGQTDRVGLVGRSLGEKSSGVGVTWEPICTTKRRPNQSPLLVRHPGPKKWGLCDEGSEPNLGEN